tara:strand:- start:611 stop:817 length:207 start_codon:yes stop_codon:yes gene_type:complete
MQCIRYKGREDVWGEDEPLIEIWPVIPGRLKSFRVNRPVAGAGKRGLEVIGNWSTQHWQHSLEIGETG